MDPIVSVSTFQFPIRIANHVNGPRILDAANNVIAYGVDYDESGALTEIAALLNVLHSKGVIENSVLTD